MKKARRAPRPSSTGVRVHLLPDFLEGAVGIADMAYNDPTGRNVTEAEREEMIRSAGRAGGQRRQIDRAQTINALKDALAQTGLLHVAKHDHLLVDGEKSLVEFKPVGVEAIFGTIVIQLLADIRDYWNGEECDRADGVRGRPRIFWEQADRCGNPAKEASTPHREKQLQRQLSQ